MKYTIKEKVVSFSNPNYSETNVSPRLIYIEPILVSIVSLLFMFNFFSWCDQKVNMKRLTPVLLWRSCTTTFFHFISRRKNLWGSCPRLTSHLQCTILDNLQWYLSGKPLGMHISPLSWCGRLGFSYYTTHII
jgi:hypothetical protein